MKPQIVFLVYTKLHDYPLSKLVTTVATLPQEAQCASVKYIPISKSSSNLHLTFQTSEPHGQIRIGPRLR